MGVCSGAGVARSQFGFRQDLTMTRRKNGSLKVRIGEGWKKMRKGWWWRNGGQKMGDGGLSGGKEEGCKESGREPMVVLAMIKGELPAEQFGI